MIEVIVVLSSEGAIGELIAEGHAGFALKGADIVCSAFTVLLRTFARTVEASPGVSWNVRGDRPGCFHVVVSTVSPVVAEQYRGWSEFVLRGFEDLARDFPGQVRIQYGKDSGRSFYGS